MSGEQRNPYGIPQAKNPAWFRVDARNEAAEDGTTTANVYVYDAIDGWWGVDPAEFVQAIDALDVDQINLYVNSPGGSIMGAQAMTNALARSSANVTAYVDGIAASAASFLITGANEVVMGAGSQLMIHDGIGLTWGNAADHQATIDILDRMSNGIAARYAAKAGGTADEWRQVMKAEAWYDADEAIAAGLADRKADADPDEDPDDIENRFDLSMYAYAGRSHAPKPPMPGHATATVAANSGRQGFLSTLLNLPKRGTSRPAEPDDTTNHTEEVEQMPDIKKVTDRLGLSAEATEDEIVNAIDALAPRGASSLPEGMRAIDSAQYDALVADAAAGREAREEQNTARRAATVENAIKAGKIPAGRRDHYAALLERDEEGMTDWLNELPANTIPVTTLGNSGGVDEATDEDALYKNFFPKTAENQEA
jgi:ATP-dependent protease ClpP protease subunit